MLFTRHIARGSFDICDLRLRRIQGSINTMSTSDVQGEAAVHFSLGKNKYDNAPAQMVCRDFDEFEATTLAARSPQKGLTFICAPLAAGPHYQKPTDNLGESHWRLKDYVRERRFLAFDFDGFADPAAYRATMVHLAKYRGFGYTTASHTPQAPRARAVLAATRPVSRSQAIILCEALQAEMTKVVGADAITFDASVYRGEQPVYTPVVSSETIHFDGQLVDVDVLLRYTPSVPAFHAAGGASLNSNLGVYRNGFAVPDLVEDGQGRETILIKYAGHLRSKGLDQCTIERTLLDYNQCHIHPPLCDDLVIDKARRYQQATNVNAAHLANEDAILPTPSVLAEHLPPVPRFHLKLLPNEIADYVQDVSERMCCPPDFPGVAAMVAMSAAIGSRIHCKPYANGNWLVPAGAWGMVVSPPSAVKSPPLSEMLRPLYKLDKAAASQFAEAIVQHDIQKQIYDNAVKASIKQGVLPAGLVAPKEPAMTRYVVNDSTYEMLVAIAAANPNGFLIWRDELMGWFHSLNKENQKEARGLYLTGWTGTEGYATDRVGRGHVRAERVNLSLLGTIQPHVLRGIVHDAVAGGAGDDGLVARFQLAVYPDPVPTYTKVDRQPNLQAMQHYENLIQKLAP